MPVEIRVPPLGESLVDAVVGQWLKSEGDSVNRGETIVELETDKVNLDVTAPEDGVLSKIDHASGDIVTVGDLLGTVAEGAGNGAGSAPKRPSLRSRTPAPAAATATPETPAAAPETSVPADGGRAAPAVRMLAGEHNVDLNAITGTGPGGRVTREDVLSASAARLTTAPAGPSVTTSTPPTPPAPPTPLPSPATNGAASAARNGAGTGEPREERVRMTRRRQTIAARLVEAQHTAAMLTTFNEVDMSAIMDLRAARKDAFKEKHGVGLGFMSFFTKAVVGALTAFPRLNGEIQGDRDRSQALLRHWRRGQHRRGIGRAGRP